jgi:predicted SprT family Zn-dependent metalloprotease
MSGRFETARDFAVDTRSDLSGGDGNVKPDHGGDLAKKTGADLNAKAGDALEHGATETTTEQAGENLNDTGTEHLDALLDNFHESNWGDLSLEDQKQSMTDLATFVASDTGNENPPEIVFRDDMPDGSYGGYNPESNKIEINENMLDDSTEAADTIAHEMWHAHQHQCAQDPANERAAEYQEGFDNYISPEYDFEAYQNQMVEAEARDYAQGFTDKLGAT